MPDPQNKETPMNCLDLDAHYESIRQVLDRVREAAAAYEKATGCEDYLNPFRAYDFERALKELRKSLIEHVSELYRRSLCPNVDIRSRRDLEELMTKKFGEQGFNAAFVAGWIKKNFADRQGKLAWEQMMEGARYMLPSFSVEGRYGSEPAWEPGQVVKGLTLQLRLHVWSDGRLSFHSHDYAKRMNDLGKVARVVLRGEDPAQAQYFLAGQILQEAGRLRDPEMDQVMRKEHGLTDPLASLRFFKNGRLVVKLKTPEEALKLAKALVKPRNDK